jgi:ATP-dependent Clp protease ATP-binding subunit ClpB
LRAIAEIQVGHLRGRLAERRIGLEPTGAALDWLTEHGYDPSYGARPLKRLVQKALGDPLAVKLVEGEYAEGDTITVDVGPDGLEFS